VQDIGTLTPWHEGKSWAVPRNMCTNLMHSDLENEHEGETGSFLVTTRYMSPRGSDNGHYGAHSLALRNEIRTWCCVEKSAVTKNEGILLPNLLQSSRSTFSWESFLSFFGFKEGMWDTQISALGGWPTVSEDFPTQNISRENGCYLLTILGWGNTRFSSPLCVQKELLRWVFLNRSLKNPP
jgi:hypothetical protein